MKTRLLFLAILLSGLMTISAAPFQNIKKILRQPDGTELHCFASGDEFYNRLHDAEGYTIVQADNGFFVYATTDAAGNVIPTQYVAGTTDPESLGLKPNIMISQEEYQKKRDMMKVMDRDSKDDAVLNHGTYTKYPLSACTIV